MTPTLKLALDLSFTHTEGAWRSPGSWVNGPYYIARQASSLGHVTGGRIAVDLVTSARELDAAKFGFYELMEHPRTAVPVQPG